MTLVNEKHEHLLKTVTKTSYHVAGYDGEEWGAEYSDDAIEGESHEDSAQFRFKLWRVWDQTKPYAMFTGLNPSTATHLVDDPTVFRCRCDAMNWGCGGMYMMNVSAYRATDPRVMMSWYRLNANTRKRRETDCANLSALADVAEKANPIICAWSGMAKFFDMDKTAYQFLTAKGYDLKCLRMSTNGKYPWHRLYLPHGLHPIPYQPQSR